MKNSTKKLTYSALFLALGVIFPQIFHLFGGTGPIFLPMHIPVLLAGFFLGGSFAALVGFLTVLTSAAITGMPQPPVLYFMLVEVTMYGLVAGLAYDKLKLPTAVKIYTSLILAMVVGRLTLAVTVYGLQPLLGLKLSPQVYMTGAIVKGIPGILIQIIFIPILVFALTKAGVKVGKSRTS
jgi:hypothetical protein